MDNPRLLPDFEKTASIQKGDSFRHKGETFICTQNINGMVFWENGYCLEYLLTKIEKEI